METATACALLQRVDALDAAAADADALAAGLADVGALRRFLDWREFVLVHALGQVASFPEKVVAEAERVPFRAAEQAVKRADLLATSPVLAAALADGRLSGTHVDVFRRALASLELEDRPLLVTQTEPLVARGASVDADEFSRVVRKARDAARRDNGIDRFRRQQLATRFTTWVDNDTGMWNFRGEFDPLTGARLAQAIKERTEAIFHDKHPDTAPSDPVARLHHLRALGFADLVLNGGVGRSGRADLTAVVDLSDTPPGGTATIEWALPGIDIPLAALVARHKIDVTCVFVRNGVVVDAPGKLNAGRTARHANRDQRRALSALYRTCGIPGCTVPYDDCVLHHLRRWRDGGDTDLANLFPVCVRHHHCIHDAAWHLELGPNRELTVTTPDGQVHATGPPRRRRPA